MKTTKLTFAIMFLLFLTIISAYADRYRYYELGYPEGVWGEEELVGLWPSQIWHTYLMTEGDGRLKIAYYSSVITEGISVRMMYRINGGDWTTIDHANSCYITIYPIYQGDLVGVRFGFVTSPWTTNLYNWNVQHVYP